MKITVVMEDTAAPSFIGEHGLSLHIKTENHSILSDTGASAKTFINAEKVKVDIKNVDTVFISHGHYDHAGGLLAFCEQNKIARIYIKNSAFGRFYHGEKYIGVNSVIADLPNAHKISGEFTEIDDELSIFSAVTGRKLYPQSNLELSEKTDEGEICDSFVHEQYLVVKEKGKRVLFSGCAHNGIVNIIEKFFDIYGEYPSAVFSGFHLNRAEFTDNDIKIISETAAVLSKMPTAFYTGHCTGQAAYEIMKKIMGEKLVNITAGDEFSL